MVALDVVTCSQCQERMVADRLSDHLRYQHGAPRTRCDHCEGPLSTDGSPSYGKRFCRRTCQTLNRRARLKAREALEAYKAERGL